MNRHYTHIESSAKRAVVDKVPEIGTDVPIDRKK
jgi:hypothetical protein